MPTSTDINLPKDHKAVFPDRCVACGTGQPDSTYRATTHAIGWWTVAFWASGPRFSVDVPACSPCRGQMRRQKWIRFAVSLTVIVVGMVIAVALFRVQGPFRKWLALGVVIVCLSPVIAWEMIFPPPIDLTAFTDTVDYEFRDPEYAAEFAALNKPPPDGGGG